MVSLGFTHLISLSFKTFKGVIIRKKKFVWIKNRFWVTSFASLYDILVVSFNAQNSSDKERHKTGVVVIRWHDSKMIN